MRCDFSQYKLHFALPSDSMLKKCFFQPIARLVPGVVGHDGVLALMLGMVEKSTASASVLEKTYQNVLVRIVMAPN